jgi:hypothetical protein
VAIFISEIAGFTWLLYYAALQVIGAIGISFWDRNFRVWATLLNSVPSVAVLVCVFAYNYQYGIRAGQVNVGVRWDYTLYPNLLFEIYLLLTFKTKSGRVRALTEKIMFIVVSIWLLLVAFAAAAMAFG